MEADPPPRVLTLHSPAEIELWTRVYTAEYSRQSARWTAHYVARNQSRHSWLLGAALDTPDMHDLARQAAEMAVIELRKLTGGPWD